MDNLLEFVGQFYQAFRYFQKLKAKHNFPIDERKMEELSAMMAAMRKLILEQKAEVEASLMTLADDAAVEELISKVGNPEARRTRKS